MYQELPDSVERHAEDIKLQCVPNNFVDSFLQRLLPAQRISSGENDLKHRHLQLDNLKKRVAATTKPEKKKKTLTVKDRKELKIFDIDKKNQRYDSYLQLHHLWLGYVDDVINFDRVTPKNIASAQQQMIKCDLHGCIIKVQRSKCPSYVGLQGIVLKETRNMFQLITRDNKIKSVPKSNCVFTFEVKGYEFTIYGNNFRAKSGMRMLYKFKRKATLDL